MTSGIKTVIYPVKDLAQAKARFATLTGADPVVDGEYYVQFKVGDQEIGLDPNGHSKGMTGPVDYWHVEDLTATLESLTAAGAEANDAVKDFGERLVASVIDPDGNVVGLIQQTS